MAKTIGSFDLASLKNLRDDVTQYFWFESNSSSAWGSGAHVTLYPESQFTDSTNPNYMKGQNIIMNTDGFSIRNGGLPMMVLDNNSLDFNAVDTSLGTYTTMATFGLTGATIGQTSGAHSVIDTNGQRFYASDGTTQLANIGYGEGATIGSGTSTAPYYSLGSRTTTTQQYNPSATYDVGDVCLYDDEMYVCKTKIETPEAWTQSHWKYSIGNYSFAGGHDTIAAGYSSTAEGGSTRAIGSFSHAEGYRTRALGDYSHAAGVSTITNPKRDAQTVIGQYNIPDTSVPDILDRGGLLLIIGNGIGIHGATNERSNALTVDWYGNVEAAGEFITRQTTLNLGVYVASGVLTSNAGLLTFSIPTGRVFPSGTTISKITFDILARASSANGTGYYIIESTTTSSDVASFDSSTSKTFHNANDTTQTITSAMWTKELYGGTNIYIAFSGGTDFFSGTTTIRNYINNNAAAIYLSNIVVTLSVPSA